MAKASVAITTNNQMSPGLAQAKKQMLEFQQTCQKVGNVLKTAFNVTAIYVGLKKIGTSAMSAVSDFETAAKAYRQLAMTMKSQADYNTVTQSIARLTRQTMESKSSIEAMAAQLGMLGKSGDEIDKIASASVYLSNVTGKSLKESMNQLMKTTAGEVGELKQYGLGLENLSKEQLKNGEAIQFVIDKYADLSAQIAETTTAQHIKNLKDNLGDLKQEIGGVINFSLGPVITNLDSLLNSVMDRIKNIIRISGAAIASFPQLWSRTVLLLDEMWKTMWSWENISSFIKTTAENIVIVFRGLFDALEQITGGFFRWSYNSIMSDVFDLLAVIPRLVENTLNNILDSISNSKIGQLMNFKGGNIDLTSTIKDKSRQYNSAAIQSRQDMSLSGAISTLFSSISQANSNRQSDLKDTFGDLLSGYGNDIEKLVSPAFANITSYLSGIEVNGQRNITTLTGLQKLLQSNNFLDKFAGKIGSYAQGLFSGTTDEQSASFGTAVVSAFSESMGKAGKLAGELAENMARMGPILGAIATALKYIFEGLYEIIGEVLDNIIEYGLEPLREIGRVIGELILPIMEALSPHLEKIMEISKMLFNALGSVIQPIFNMIAKVINVLTPLFDILVPIMELIAGVLQSIGVIIESIFMPVFDAIGDVLKSIIAPVLKVIGTILKILTPILKVFAKIIITITGTFQYIGQVLKHWVATFCNWLANLSIFGWHPFKGLAMDDPGSPGSYAAYIKDKWASIDEAFSEAQYLTGSTTSSATSSNTETSVSSAGYQGATQVTINIYQEAPVVGDSGMREFARMIKTEFDNLSYYGVTA